MQVILGLILSLFVGYLFFLFLRTFFLDDPISVRRGMNPIPPNAPPKPKNPFIRKEKRLKITDDILLLLEFLEKNKYDTLKDFIDRSEFSNVKELKEAVVNLNNIQLSNGVIIDGVRGKKNRKSLKKINNDIKKKLNRIFKMLLKLKKVKDSEQERIFEDIIFELKNIKK